MYKYTCLVGLLIANLFVVPATYANNFNYNYGEVLVPLNPGGLGVGGSMLIHQNAHVVAEATSSFDSDWSISAGAGFNAPVSQFADLRGYFKVHSQKLKKSDDNFGRFFTELSFDASAWVNPVSEVGVSAGAYLISDDNTKMKLHTYYRFHPTPTISLAAALHISGLQNGLIMLSARYPLG
ncbi:hypothetical protein A3K86_21110 [Photobacterium jeanii]|uniref:Outer membrane protein beta-barrel domain-containing protein n=1 Tax=Photobacterium jeanii TaxID=858640 RepID=A0A178K415_9GAMM|nr:hypothetical protein [Photobacterium jeanii]OAN11443.1 hypothetical protein A3K86_21110 [Photobacterium jeanii]PST90962.1 hypothetical protein C9I91_10215 [Photobacterium jeanii]